MLKIHKSHSKKLLLIPITSICITFGLLGFYYLTYTPELSHAETVTYPEKETRTMADITYMQEINPQICANTPEADTAGNNQYQLIDKRDSKTYWVAKLKDGNCWMTQSLALDLNSSRPIMSEESDLISDWTPPANTQQGTITKFANEDDPTFSFNPGEYTYTTPTEFSVCGNVSNNSKIDKLADCPGWSLVYGLSMNKTGDSRAHYLAGNYYSHRMATAETSASLTVSDSNSPGSICPRGWKLPESRQYNMLLSGFSRKEIKLAPYYFGFSGYVSSSRLFKYLYDAGDGGYWWSSTIASSNNAYAMYDTIYVSPLAILNVANGQSVRCVVRSEVSRNVEIAVNPAISLDVANEIVVGKSETNPSTADLKVKVSTNQKYTLGISADNPSLTSSTSNVNIPAKSGLLNTTENGWGIKLKENTEFTALSTNLQTFYTASGAEIKTIPFTIGISTAPDIPNGEYSTNITITATQN